MATKFRYVAVFPKGGKTAGVIEAENLRAAKDAVDARGMIPVSVKEASRTLDNLLLLTRSTVKHESLIFFTRKLLTLSRAGIPLLRSLDIIIEDTPDKKLGRTLEDVRRSLSGGEGLGGALERHIGYFPAVYIEAIKAGEESGMLDVMLSRNLELLQREARIKDGVRAAVRYPFYVLITMTIAFSIIVTLVIPKFAGIYSSYGSELPWATRLLVSVNYITATYWPILLVVLPFLALLIWRLRLTRYGKRGYDYFMVAMPVFGSVVVKSIMSRFCYTLATLLSAGMSLSRALSIVKDSIGNFYFSKVISKVGENLSGGQDLVGPLKDSRYFSPLVVQMFTIGLESGSLENLLMETAGHFDAEIEYDTKKLTSRIEPLLTVVIAAMVLILALAIFTPMWNLIGVFNK